MFTVLIGIYVFFITLIAVFFVLTKIHAYKYKSFSTNIEKYTQFFVISLIICSIIGIGMIFKMKNDIQRTMVDEETSIDSVYY